MSEFIWAVCLNADRPNSFFPENYFASDAIILPVAISIRSPSSNL